MSERYCNKVNFFCDDGARDTSHAFQLRGKHIMQAMPHKRRTKNRVHGRVLIAGILIIGVVSFLGSQVWHLAMPPHLSVQSPADGFSTHDPQVTVRGVAEPESVVEINGQQVFSGPNGAFVQPVELQPGANKIFVRAMKKHGLFTTVTRTVMLDNAPADAAPPLSALPQNSPVSLN